MKNKLLLTLFTLAFSLGLLAQPSTAGRYAQATQAAAIAPADASAIIQEVIDVVGLKPNFDVRATPQVPNAAAVIYGGKRYILYNPNFFTSLTRATGSKWAAVSVLAHEIGHHLDGHTLSQIGSQPQSELEADEFSGFVLRKMGASLTDAQVAMKTAASQRGSTTHPGQYDRLVAIADGWNKADAQATGRKYTAQSRPAPQPPVASVQVPAANAVIGDRSIIGDVRFAADAGAAYYITTRYNLVRVKDNNISVVGKLTTLNSSTFPYLIYDGSNVQLLVDAYGNIVTKNGRRVGQLRARG